MNSLGNELMIVILMLFKSIKFFKSVFFELIKKITSLNFVRETVVVYLFVVVISFAFKVCNPQSKFVTILLYFGNTDKKFLTSFKHILGILL